MAETSKDAEIKSVGSDTVDQSCMKCIPANSNKIKEDLSLSISSDDETDQAISLNMNKKSNVSYNGKTMFLSNGFVIFSNFEKNFKSRNDGHCLTHRKRKSTSIFDNIQFRRENFYHQRHFDRFITDRSGGCWNWNDFQG